MKTSYTGCTEKINLNIFPVLQYYNPDKPEKDLNNTFIVFFTSEYSGTVVWIGPNSDCEWGVGEHSSSFNFELFTALDTGTGVDLRN